MISALKLPLKRREIYIRDEIISIMQLPEFRIIPLGKKKREKKLRIYKT